MASSGNQIAASNSRAAMVLLDAGGVAEHLLPP